MPDETPEPKFTPPKQTHARGITPEQAKEPPKEILEQTFSMDPALLGRAGEAQVKIGEEGTITDGEKKVEEPKKEEKKVEKVAEQEKVEPKPSTILKPPAETKKEEVKVQEGEKKEVIKQIVPPSKDKPATRDYTGYSAEETAILKAMSNDAFDYTTKLIKESKENAKLKDSTFLQHPEAYTLSPEFKDTQRDVYFANREGQEWAKMLEQCKAGKPFKELTGFDNNGNPTYGAEIQPNDSIEERLRLNMNNCFGIAQQKQGKLNELGNTFKTRVQSDSQAIQQERAARFAWVSDPKLLDYTINIEGVGEKSIKQIREDMISLFPPYYRNSPGVEVAADLIVALRIQHAELQQALAGKGVAEIKKEEAMRGEPSSHSKPKKESESVNGSPKEFSLSGMPS